MKKTKTILDNVTWPDALDLHGRATVSLTTLARAVADDNYEGDDAVGPRNLLVGALDAVKLGRLRTLVRESGGKLVLTPQIAMSVVETDEDSLLGLGSWAWADADLGVEEARCGSRCAALCHEHAALVLVAGVILHTRSDASRRAEVQESVDADREGPLLGYYKSPDAPIDLDDTQVGIVIADATERGLRLPDGFGAPGTSWTLFPRTVGVGVEPTIRCRVWRRERVHGLDEVPRGVPAAVAAAVLTAVQWRYEGVPDVPFFDVSTGTMAALGRDPVDLLEWFSEMSSTHAHGGGDA